ncbi:hypothetical protein A3218_05905 [Pseudomonas chlororaphis]|nr:hypothetical protein A3218_05905 [Pseudomonas chlororaphis]
MINDALAIHRIDQLNTEAIGQVLVAHQYIKFSPFLGDSECFGAVQRHSYAEKSQPIQLHGQSNQLERVILY